jgi:hypothetical protein
MMHAGVIAFDQTSIDAMMAILGWLVTGMIGAAIGSFKGRARAGFVLGLILGPFGWIIALFLRRRATSRAAI